MIERRTEGGIARKERRERDRDTDGQTEVEAVMS